MVLIAEFDGYSIVEPADTLDADGRLPVPLVASAAEFANPWHDEQGLFAPKGLGSPAAAQRVVPTIERDADGQIVVSEEAHRLAADIHERAQAAEPEITSTLAKLVGDADPEGYVGPAEEGDLYGFQHRLKTPEAMAGKIERVVEEKGLTREEAAADIKDSVRYTVHFPQATFGQDAQSVVDELRKSGEVRVKNTWPPESGVPYKGINAVVTRPDGVRYEVQFHTPESQAVKDRMHVAYEEQRVLPKDSPRWQELEQEMIDIGTTLPVPTGAVEVFSWR